MAVKNEVLVDRDDLRKKRIEVQSEFVDLKKRLNEETNKSATMETQLRQIGNVVCELISGVDPKVLKATLDGAATEQRESILGALKEAKGKNAAQVVQMLRKSAELKKQCDVWEIHLNPDGSVRVRAPDIRDQEFVPNDENDFSIRFMQIVKESREPKSLVIIMFTHRNAELRSLAVVGKGLEQVRKTWSKQLAAKKVLVTAPNFTPDPP